MADRNLCAGLVVWEEAEGVGIFDPRIHLDDRQTEAAGMIEFAAVGPARGDHEAVDGLADELIDVPPLAHRIISGVAHEDSDAVIEQALLEGL